MVSLEQPQYGHRPDQTPSNGDDLPAVVIAQDLLDRCSRLLDELEQFGHFLSERKRHKVIGHSTLIGDIKSEKRFIERLLEAHNNGTANPGPDDAPETRIKHQLSSTNLASYEAQWTAVKRCKGLIALRQTFWRDPDARRNGPSIAANRALSPGSKIKANVKKSQNAVLVDAVIDGGSEWLKVSAISERQLLFQMASLGWRNDDSDDTDDDIPPQKRNGDDDDDEDEVPIVRLAKHLTEAARSNRHNYRHPTVRIVLPKISSKPIKEIAALFSKIRATGAILECADEISAPPPADEAFQNLLVDEFRDFTDVLNIDCTLLVALASDISHGKVEPQPWFPTAVQGQIKDENEESLMPHTLYPAMGSRRLVCTTEAAQRMREIVATIGTETEVARTNILIPTPESSASSTPKPRAEILAELQALSIHPVPGNLQLPIQVLNKDVALANGKDLPKVAENVEEVLTDINRSIFLFGWRMGYTTLSSNGTVSKMIEGVVEKEGSGTEIGPSVWVCPVARSLVAKSGRRRK
ncbi:hypothetical protein K490DRAFT_65327 [Saccharata proteae CBS 121410]|uniref:DUF1308 domain-containing protein n=1 Tax=Saccharata proteae CBS 121410 TaxID=1314787 RepID=A0A9P4HX27_9PEZI|nr:hypothetical protein K490DRAFT_65327 [Saccharata proteae CBS 121410]